MVCVCIIENRVNFFLSLANCASFQISLAAVVVYAECCCFFTDIDMWNKIRKHSKGIFSIFQHICLSISCEMKLLKNCVRLPNFFCLFDFIQPKIYLLYNFLYIFCDEEVERREEKDIKRKLYWFRLQVEWVRAKSLV